MHFISLNYNCFKVGSVYLIEIIVKALQYF